MKKILIACALLSFCSSTLIADPTTIDVVIDKKGDDNHSDRNRAPMRVPVEIWYDSDCSMITVCGPEQDGTVCILNRGTVINAADCINSSFILPESVSGLVTILIEADEWTATGLLNL